MRSGRKPAAGGTLALMPVSEITPNPSSEDAAALIAAVERFLADTATPVPSVEEGQSGWQRAALLEAVGRSDENAIWR